MPLWLSEEGTLQTAYQCKVWWRWEEAFFCQERRVLGGPRCHLKMVNSNVCAEIENVEMDYPKTIHAYLPLTSLHSRKWALQIEDHFSTSLAINQHTGSEAEKDAWYNSKKNTHFRIGWTWIWTSLCNLLGR